MIRTAKVLYCDMEHGTGDVTFPAICDLDPINPMTVAELRRRAKAAGWSRYGRNDFCESCTESDANPS